MSSQTVLQGQKDYDKIKDILVQNNVKKIFLVCGKSYRYLPIKDYIDNLNIKKVTYSNFTPNPLYESVKEGVELFHKENCDFIIAVGGGSAIDVAKCIKLFSNMNSEDNFLKQPIVQNNIKILAIPTTAGTGSEATRFAVIYYDGKKQSVTHESIIPEYVLLDSELLNTLPDLQKKVTVLDAFCHAIESYWSINSNAVSMEYSKKAIKLINDNMNDYLYSNMIDVNDIMLLAANLAGKAINITQTTACHAMSYKITSFYKISHGQAVAICVPAVWRFMLEHPEKCCDPRGYDHLIKVFNNIAENMGCNSIEDAIKYFESLIKKMQLPNIRKVTNLEIEELVQSVNIDRIKNNPILLDQEDIRKLYCQILK